MGRYLPTAPLARELCSRPYPRQVMAKGGLGLEKVVTPSRPYQGTRGRRPQHFP